VHAAVCWWAKIGWVWFKRSRGLAGWKSYRISRDRAGRWHIALAVIPEPIPAPGAGGVVGVDRGVTAVSRPTACALQLQANVLGAPVSRLLVA
jgi:hypothetical protein